MSECVFPGKSLPVSRLSRLGLGLTLAQIVGMRYNDEKFVLLFTWVLVGVCY